ncbi:MAG: DUF2726 domain-containing protein, partial [Nitrospirota bacterium]|nr:DUF2726 domain-containing protein [Nitrospirota bacterium]
IIEHYHTKEKIWSPTAYKRKNDFLTLSEKIFYDSLINSIQHPHYQILSKVRVADLFDIIDYNNHELHFDNIKALHIDFLIYNPYNNKTLLAIELDDSSHLREDRIKRDKFINELFRHNQFPLIRQEAKPSYNISELRNKINSAIA